MQRFLVVIPLYNHGDKVGAAIDDVMHQPLAQPDGSLVPVLVLDDGSTDQGRAVAHEAMQRYNIPDQPPRLNLLCHEKNMGKGRAIMSAAAWANSNGFTHIITMDADGQHLASDLPAFTAAVNDAPGTLWVGYRDFSVANVPRSSAFGRAFSAFWMRLQTGIKAPDMQSGFRAYPVATLRYLACGESGYSFETEVLVRAAWAGFKLGSVPVQVFYPPQAERISHFRMFYDNLRISILNTRLTVRALIPLPFSQHNVDGAGVISSRRPLAALHTLLMQSNTPALLAFSTFITVLINMLPIIGLQSILLLFLIGLLNLNRVWSLTVTHLCWPPIVIAIDIEAGHFIRHGEFLTDISLKTLGREGLDRLFEWVLGGVLFGPVFALFWAGLVYLLAVRISSRLHRHNRTGA